MKKSAYTKASIIEKSSVLFNTKGYKNTSISDITTATGFTKGAIYRHFDSKEQLEEATFEYLTNMVISTMRYKIKQKETAVEKLNVLFRFFESYATNPIIEGGCPLMNLAIEIDDTQSPLIKKAQYLLEILKQSVVHILNNGIKYKQLIPNTPSQSLAVIIIASLEGAIMTSKLTASNQDLKIVIQFLRTEMQRYKK